MEETQRKLRIVLHIALDAYYASIGQRDHPELRGKPIVVGGSPQSRGVVATCAYEACSFGVRSAMPARTAHRFYTQAIFLPPHFDMYRAVSAQIMAIFKSITSLVGRSTFQLLCQKRPRARRVNCDKAQRPLPSRSKRIRKAAF
jgi:impB/mucB/samB family